MMNFMLTDAKFQIWDITYQVDYRETGMTGSRGQATQANFYVSHSHFKRIPYIRRYSHP